MPELLAPAGHTESFWAAVENGADAVYLGLKQLSARASATNFSLEELAVLLPYAHRHDVSIYVALNSLLAASDLPRALDLLQSLSDLKVDALIVQDPGIFFLARQFFPSLRLHASTLMAVHNHAGVNQLDRMGAQRVVLARELNLPEIKAIAERSKVELEVFVHGALCYAYSGLCLASSFRGGHSSLEGRCVQPCRLQFRQGKKEGFFLSCNDLCALSLIPELKKLRIAAFKIEGRMKSADYITQVVRAYRLLLDAPPGEIAEAMTEARELLARAPSRRLTLGHFSDDSRSEILSPHRTGSSGQWIGTIRRIDGHRALIALRHALHPGDRLRPESREGREKQAFTVSEILSEKAKSIPFGPAGSKVLLTCKIDLRPGERLIRVGARDRSSEGAWQKIQHQIPAGRSFGRRFPKPEIVWQAMSRFQFTGRDSGETLILRIADAGDIPRAFESSARWVILTATRLNLERFAKQRLSAAQKRRFAWSLPPIIFEKDDHYYRSAVRWFLERGFHAWELNNWGHFDLFEKREGLTLIAGFRFNVRNLAAMTELRQAGSLWNVLSLEITRDELQLLARGPLTTMPVVTLFFWPPLFTSRLIPDLDEKKPFRTPRDETYTFEKRGGNALVYADRPVNWLEHLPALRQYGFRCFLLDLSDGPSGRLPNIERLLQGYRESRADKPFSLFNLDRSPL